MSRAEFEGALNALIRASYEQGLANAHALAGVIQSREMDIACKRAGALYAAAIEERDDWKLKAGDAAQTLETWMEAQKFSTPNDPTGVRNGLRFKAIEAERNALAAAAIRYVDYWNDIDTPDPPDEMGTTNGDELLIELNRLARAALAGTRK